MEQDEQAKLATNDSSTDQQQQRQQFIREVQGPVEKKMRPSDIVEYDKLLTELADQLKIARHPDPLVLLKATRLLIESDDCLSSSSSSSLDQSNKSQTQEQKELRGQSATTIEQQTQSANSSAAAAAAAAPANDNGDFGGANRIKRQQDDTEIRIQQSKFVLDDVMLPKSLIKSAKSNLSSKQQKQQQELDGADEQVSMSCSGDIGPIVSHEAGTTKVDLVKTFERASKTLKLLYMNDQRQLQNQVNVMISSIQSITANPKTDSRLLATGR